MCFLTICNGIKNHCWEKRFTSCWNFLIQNKTNVNKVEERRKCQRLEIQIQHPRAQINENYFNFISVVNKNIFSIFQAAQSCFQPCLPGTVKLMMVCDYTEKFLVKVQTLHVDIYTSLVLFYRCTEKKLIQNPPVSQWERWK